MQGVAAVAAPDPDDRTDPTENARRAARYTFARKRIKKIVDGMPPLTDEQLSKLAVLLQAGAGE
jgi:hypothetical protein